jgi:hypothetical protein
MLTLPRCHILVQDEVFPEVAEGGLAVIVGESPNATVRLSTPDPVARKYVTFDRLTRASYSRKGDTWTFTGVSDHLVNTVGASGEHAVLSIQVTPEPGCEGCRK